MVIEDLVNLKEDGVSAEEAIDFSEQYHISETTKMEAEN